MERGPALPAGAIEDKIDGALLVTAPEAGPGRVTAALAGTARVIPAGLTKLNG
jgi:hypothetical protein